MWPECQWLVRIFLILNLPSLITALPAEPSECPELKHPDNGKVDYTRAAGSTAAYTCDPGYKLAGTNFRECTEKFEWTLTAPTCNIRDCGEPILPASVSATYSKTTYNSSLTYSCSTGYTYVSGSTSARCNKEGVWDNSPPTCNIDNCGSLTDPVDGNVTVTGTTFGSTASYKCIIGYHITRGNEFRTCEAGGTWSGSDPICSIQNCGPFGEFSGGNISVTATTYGSKASIECKEGFTLNGESLITCQEDGNWETLPTCDIKNCGDISTPLNGTKETSSGTTYNSVATFRCNEGFNLEGQNSSLCLANGSWSNIAPTCVIVDCGKLDPPEFGGVNHDPGTKYKFVAAYTCEDGYDLKGNNTRRCQATGQWSDSAPTCELFNCGEPSELLNGKVEVDDTVFGSTASYSCDPGYLLWNGNVTRTCGQGTWSGTKPSCKDIDECAMPDACHTEATCENTDGSYTCSCNTGYSGNGQSCTEIDECATGSHDCDANAQCENKPGTYTCECNSGFEGDGRSCTDINECSIENDCHANAECVNNPGSYTCKCNDGYSGTGRSCTDIDECADKLSNCHSDATCKNEDGTFQCTCKTGFTGTGTECTDFDECTAGSHTCHANAACDNSPGTYTCECNEGYAGDGRSCNDINECETEDPCHTNARCRNTEGSYRCRCFAGYTGDGFQCDEIDECAGEHDCDTNAVCTNEPGTYDCTCNTGFTGDGRSCTDINECETGDSKCDENAKCTNSPGNFSCACNEGYSGDGFSCEDCGTLSQIDNGNVTQNGTTYPSSAKYTCNTGYYVTSGNETRICQANGLWDGTEPVCTIRDCKKLIDPTHATTTYTSTEYKGIATFSCIEGYEHTDGAATWKCQATGEWTLRKAFICTKYTCPAVRVPADGSAEATGIEYNDTVTFKCKEGFDLNGETNLRCGEGTWSASFPTCTRKNCGSLSTNISSGTAVQSGTEYEDTTIYTCNEGYMISVGIVGLTVTCQANGLWDGTLPSCIETNCGPLAAPKDGQVNTQPGTTYQKMASYTCETGFNLIGDNVRECQANGLWDGNAPTCKIIDCNSLTDPSDGSVDTSSGTTYPQVANYSCDPGYEITSGSASRKCQLNSTWDGTKPVCSRKDCGNLTTDVFNCNVNQSGTVYEDTTIYDCKEGFFISKGVVSRTVMCAANGQWNGTVPTCVAVDCGDLTGPYKGQIHYSNTSYRTRASFTCDLGYDLVGTNIRTCQADGNWDKSTPTCKIRDCKSLSDPEKGTVIAERTTYEATAAYKCDDGYYISSGSATRTCGVNALWNGTKAVCTIYDCETPENGTMATLKYNLTTYGMEAEYTCLTGYYHTAGSLTRTCGEGSWSDTAPTCTIRDCLELDTPAGGTVTYTATTYNQEAKYSCKTGFYIDGGNTERTCQADGKWDGTALQCVEYDCKEPPGIAFGKKEYESTLYGSLVTYTCFEGYYTESNTTLTCGTGTWNPAAPTCQIHECRRLSDVVIDGSVVISGITFSQTAVYTCDDGFLVTSTSSKTRTLTCGADGNWDNDVPTCTAINCGDLAAPKNGTVSVNKTTFSSVATFKCNPGFYISAGDETSTCGDKGVWSGTIPTCTIFDCEALDNPLHGSVTVTGTTFGETASYFCNNGYYISSGSASRTCTSTGSWDGSKPVCTQRTEPEEEREMVCGHRNEDLVFGISVSSMTRSADFNNMKELVKCAVFRSDIDAGDMKVGVYVFGAQIYNVIHLNGYNTRTDLMEAIDSIPYNRVTGPSLVRVGLAQLQGMFNVINGDRRNVSNYAFIVLDDNIDLEGSAAIANQLRDAGIHLDMYAIGFQDISLLSDLVYKPNGRIKRIVSYDDISNIVEYVLWKDSSCNCSTPDVPDNGEVKWNGTYYLDTATFTCKPGYTLFGSDTQTCQYKGPWSGTRPTCVQDGTECDALDAPLHGEVTLTGTSYLDTATFTCNPGYMLLGSGTLTCLDKGSWSGIRPTCVEERTNTFCGYLNVDVIFALGVSRTVNQSDFRDALLLPRAMVSRSDIDRGSVQFGFFVFDNAVRTDTVINLNQYSTRQDMIDAILKTPPTTSLTRSRLSVALSQIVSMSSLRTSSKPLMVYVAMDSDIDLSDTKLLAEQLRSTNVVLSFPTAELSGTQSIDYLKELAYQPNPLYVWELQSFSLFGPGFTQWILDEQCNCGQLDRPQNGSVTLTGTFFLDEALFSCNAEYRLIGSDRLMCQYGGTWSGSPPLCLGDSVPPPIDIDCGFKNIDVVMAFSLSSSTSSSDFDHMKSLLAAAVDHADIDNGNARFGTFMFDSNVRTDSVVNLNRFTSRKTQLDFVNGIQYSVSTDSKAMLAVGLWQVLAMFISQITPVLGRPMYAIVVFDANIDLNGASTVMEQLNRNKISLMFITVNHDFSTSQAMKSLPLPAEDVVIDFPNYMEMGKTAFQLFKEDNCDCGLLISPDNGNVTYETVLGRATYFLDVARFSCNGGYRLVGFQQVVCQFDGTWSGSTPTCESSGPTPTSLCGLRNIDVLLGVVLSDETSEMDFEVMKNYIKTNIDSADIDTRSTRLGLFLYGAGLPMVNIDMDAFSTRSQFYKALDDHQFVKPTRAPSLQEGLMHARNKFLGGSNRQDVPDMLIMLVDRRVDLTRADVLAKEIKSSNIHLDFITMGFIDSTDQSDKENTVMDTLGHSSHFVNSQDLQTAVTNRFFRDPACNCGNLSSIPNGGVLFEDTYYLDHATFYCGDNFDLVGSQQLTCEYGGSWSGSRPSCSQKAAQKSVDLVMNLNMTNGDVDLSNPSTRAEIKRALQNLYPTLEITINSLSFGSLVVNYTVVMQNTETSAQNFAKSSVNLAEGASIEVFAQTLTATSMKIGESTENLVSLSMEDVRCKTFLEANGQCNLGYICQIENDIPKCLPDPATDCGFPGSLLYGKVTTPDGTLYETRAIYKCNTGYNLQGAALRTCDPSGFWSPQPPTCVLIDIFCEELLSPTYGSVSLTDLSRLNSEALYSCNPGYQLSGPDRRSCSENTKWEPQQLTLCIIKDCGPLERPDFGSVSLPQGSKYGSVAEYSCWTGYRLTGQTTRQCLSTGKWSDPQTVTVCTIKDCGTLFPPMNGFVDISKGTKFGSKATYWSGSPLFAIYCGPLERPDFGSVSLPQGSKYGSVAEYSCWTGYRLTGQTTRRCLSTGKWSDPQTATVCTIKDCGLLPDLQFGQISYNTLQTVYGSVATITCYQGYYLSSLTPITRCLDSGNWDVDTLPTCIIRDCGIPPEIPNGSRTFTATTYGTSAFYTCYSGFNRTGSSRVTCNADASWDTLPVCSKINCGNLQAPVNGSVVFTSGSQLGSMATFTCNRGYYLTGSNVTRCSEGGSWTSSTPFCILHNCGQLLPPINGSVTLSSGTVYGSNARYTCKTGHRLSGEEFRTCSDDGIWEPRNPTQCSLIDCGRLDIPENGNVVQSSGTTYGQTVTFSCNLGYETFGDNDVECLSTGKWNKPPPVCQITDCGGLSNPDHGVVSASQTTFGQLAVYTCNEGYNLEGTRSRRCEKFGNWSNTKPTCLVKDCGSLVRPAFGNVDYSSSVFESEAEYRCNSGYRLEGDAKRTCTSDGRWSGSTPTCIEIVCDQIPLVAFSSFTRPVRTTLGTQITYFCNTGYQLVGEAVITCLDTSQWSDTPSCEIVDCGDLARPRYGQLTLPGGTTYGQSALFSCQTGYLPFVSVELLCQANGSWSGTPPTCQLADCGVLTDPLNGGVTISGTKYGDYATYICDAGHDLSGSPSRLCQENGKWSGSSPSCTIRDCGLIPAPTDGSVSLLSGTTYGQVAQFNCDEGYDLAGLSTLVCRAGGTWSSNPPTCLLKQGLLSKDMKLTLNLTVPSSVDFSNTVTYDNYMREVKASLTQHFAAKMGDNAVELVINSLKLGSLIVDFKLILRDSAQAVEEFTVATISLANDASLTVFNQPLGPVRLTVDNSQVNLVTLPDDELACRLYLDLIGPCQTGFVCTMVGGSPTCSPDPNTDCGVLPRPINGAVDLSGGTLLGNTVTYTCNPGFTMVGHNTRTCQTNGKWAPAAPLCTVTECGMLGNPVNGQVTVSGIAQGQTAFYSCNPGYSLIGSFMVTCQQSGQWDFPPPTCRVTGCGGLRNPVFGSVTISTDGQTATYSCQTGYTLRGDTVRTCQFNTWTGSQPVCDEIVCTSLPNPSKGRVDVSGTSFGSTATYHCTEVGYRLSSEDIRVCGQNGQWSFSAPTCNIIKCDILVPPQHGQIDSFGRTYGQTATYSCNPGYLLQGAETLTCRESGWTNTPPTCLSIGDCGTLDYPVNGYVTFSMGTAFSSKATYFCYMGYTLTGMKERVCQGNNTWSHTPPTCTLPDCGLPPIPNGGQVDYTRGTTYGRTADYMCNSGYDPIGPVSSTCQKNATWSTTPICRVKDCGPLPNPLHGFVDTIAGTTFGLTASYTCNPGYHLQGVNSRTCLATGSWETFTPSCVVKDCGSLPAPANGVVNVPFGTTYGQTATYACDPGHVRSGSPSRQCNEDGVWTSTPPTCVAIVCGSLSNPMYGRVGLTNGLVVGSSALYTCNPGYLRSPVNHTARTCKENGSWSGTSPLCILVECGGLSAPLFGSIFVNQTTYGFKATFSCNQGYMMSGSSERQCGADGYWTGTQPQCSVTDCGVLSDPDNGRVSMPDGTRFGDVAIYECNKDYSIRNNYKRTCQSNGTWSGLAPYCDSTDDFALAVGLGVGISGFLILVLVIVLIVVMLHRHEQSRHFSRRRKYAIAQPVTVAPPLPLKISTGPSVYVPYYSGPTVIDDGSDFSERFATWRSRKADYEDPLYYNTSLPRAEYIEDMSQGRIRWIHGSV